MKLPRFRIAWVMVAVAIAAPDFGAIRAIFDSTINRLIPEDSFVPLIWGALPMANVLAVGLLIGLRRPGSRRFLLGFEAFGAIALALFIALTICFHREVLTYLLFVRSVERIIGAGRPFVVIPIVCFGILVMLVGPQLAVALAGGFFSRRFKITITPR